MTTESTHYQFNREINDLLRERTNARENKEFMSSKLEALRKIIAGGYCSSGISANAFADIIAEIGSSRTDDHTGGCENRITEDQPDGSVLISCHPFVGKPDDKGNYQYLMDPLLGSGSSLAFIAGILGINYSVAPHPSISRLTVSLSEKDVETLQNRFATVKGKALATEAGNFFARCKETSDDIFDQAYTRCTKQAVELFDKSWGDTVKAQPKKVAITCP